VVKIPIGDSGQSKRREVLRLRGAIRFANRPALRMTSPLGMTGLFRMTRLVRNTMLMCGVFACLLSSASATTYYVSSSTGSDSNAGTSSGVAWQTVAKVNAQAFLPGDSILFRRGDVWNESLTPGSSGAAGNPIVFDAYGVGAAPNLTGYNAVPSSAWVLVTGNAWKAAVPATFSTVNFCLFGSVWGQKVAASTSNLTAQWNFYLASGFIYVFSVGNPGSYYNSPIVPMALSNTPVINVNGKSWLSVQHFLVNWFDQYGVYVQGASDHLVFANMEVDSMIPQGTQPLGFYVNESAPGPGDVKIYNAEAHMNYDGFRFDGAAMAITMVNDKAYGNRDGALVDNTGAVTYSYCHFYASSLAVAGSTDVEWTSGTGPVAGAGNVAQDTPPAVQAWQRYPAEVTLTVDDAGMTAGADSYYANTVLPIADGLGVPVGAAITVGYPLAQTLVSEFQGWVNAGRDVTSHSVSHTYYTNTDALEIQYTGTGTASSMSISGKTLTITVTGAADSVSYNLAQGQAQGTIKALRLALLATGKYTATEITLCQGPYGTGCSYNTESALLAQDLADVSSQDVKSAVYHMQLDVTRLTTDEITLSRQWMTTNLTGLPATPVYVYPGGYETPTMQGITAGVPYSGARGALKEDLGVKDTYASGFDVQNVTSFGVNPTWMGIAPAALNQKVQALVWKQMLWGVPWGIFWHSNELVNNDPVGGNEITNVMQDLQNSGATIKTNTGLVNWLTSGTLELGSDGNFYYKSPASSMVVDFRPTAKSPVVDAGESLGAAYQIDIDGMNQNSYGSGWEIGAHVFAGYSIYGVTPPTSSHFTIGAATNPCEPPNYCAYTGTGIVNWPAVPNMGGLTKNGTVFYDTSFPSGTPSPVVRCTDGVTAASGTSPNGSKSAGLQGSADAVPLFNANNTLLHVNDNQGDNWIVPFNSTTLVCSPAITASLNQSNPGSNSSSFNFGSGYFDWTNTAIYHGATNSTQVTPYTINSSTGTFTVGVGGGIGVTGAPEVDFQYGLPMGLLAAAWQPSHSYTSGQYVTYSEVNTSSNLDDSLSNWSICVLPSCNPGGSGTPTGTQTVNNSTPSLDGEAMQISITGTANSNALFINKPGADDKATQFTGDYEVYVPSESNVGELEYDMFQFIYLGGTGTEFMFGTQCVIGGVWDIFNQYAGTWVPTSLACSLSTGTWHHLVWNVHRVPGDTSCTAGWPCMHYDSLTIDGTVHPINLTEAAGPLPSGWAETSGIQFQIDLNGSGGTATEYLDDVNFIQSQAPDWQGSYASYANGDIILPVLNNPAGCAFKLVTTGTNGSAEPTWSTAGSPCHTTSWGAYSDGTAAWESLGGSPAFTYQLTSASGTSGSSVPAFIPAATGHPDLMTTVADGSLTWTNTGVAVVPAYNSFAGVSYDGTRFCQTTSTNVYGYNASYSSINGTQGSGNWEVCYSSALNEYVTLNTTTGWQSVTTCTGGTGYNCAGGTLAMNPAGSYPVLTSGGCGFFTHGNRGSYTMTYVSIEVQATLTGSNGCDTGNDYVWNPFASFAACGPPNYCARTDLNPITLPSVPPQVGPNPCTGSLNACGNLTGAGTSFTDPNFGTAIYRITDSSTNQPTNQYYTINATASGSGEENLFSCDDSMIVVSNTGGWSYPLNFNFSSNPRIYSTTLGSTNGFVTGAAVIGWSRVCPAKNNLLYVLSGSTIESYNFAGNCATCTPPSPTTVYDFAGSSNGLGSGFRVSYSTTGSLTQSDSDFAVGFGGGPDWTASNAYSASGYVTGVISASIIFPSLHNPGSYLYQISSNCMSGSTEPNSWNQTVAGTSSDGTCTWTNIGTGTQGEQGAQYVAVYRVGSGVRVLNTVTDAVAGDWGPTGAISGTPCTAYLHNVKLGKVGGSQGWLDWTSASNCSGSSYFEWNYAASSLTGSVFSLCEASPAECGGHDTQGLLQWVNNPGNGIPKFINICAIGTCPTPTGLTYALPSGGIQSGLDMHFGWNELNDSWPFCGSTFVAGGTTKAWSNEILCFNPTYGAWNPWRLASTENTAANPDFRTDEAIGAMSQTGRWFLFTSDWQSTLGSTTGSATCTTGSSGNCRGDVFAVNLLSSGASGINMYRAGLNHYAMGNGRLFDNGQGCLDNSIGGSTCPVGTFGYATGAYLDVYQSANPYTLGNTLISWQPTPCDSRAYAAGITYTNPPCEFANAYDSHLSAAYNPGGADASPVCGSIFNDETLSPVAFAPFQGEAICVPTSPRWASGASPVGQNAPWRFTHEFNTGSNAFFDVQFAISQESTDGKFLAFSSDWNCTLGSTAGGSSSLCGVPWVGGAVYSAGQYVNPFSGAGGSGTNYGVYKITVGGTSSAIPPAWFVCNSGTAGNTVMDSSGVVYTCQGSGNGRGDVFIVRLAP